MILPPQEPQAAPASPLDNPFYYLDNFQRVIDWIGAHHADLLDDAERGFVDDFIHLPQASRALLVRMIMRRGSVFRLSRLTYAEIGDTAGAMAPLMAAGWVAADPPLTLDEMFALLTKPEIALAFALPAKQAARKKTDVLEALRPAFPHMQAFSAWAQALGDSAYRVTVDALCERLRLMFFGNLHQDWTEFVLADLGIFRYEKVALSAASRGFRHRQDLDDYVHLHRCRERFYQEEEAPHTILPDIPGEPSDNDWLENRRRKLLFRIAQHLEKEQDLPQALKIYTASGFPESRIRRIRILERLGQVDESCALAEEARSAPESEAESQQLCRILPRLYRKLGRGAFARPAAAAIQSHELVLPHPGERVFVEGLARDALAAEHAPVHYVENALINSLLGLLCWQAVFAPVPGAFFHPFQSGPSDLHSLDFLQRRKREFDACFAQLETGEYRETILRNFRDKAGLQSPFVFWGLLDEALLSMALDCLPPVHLRKWFERILQDIRANRNGLPDLIQFWPAEKRYRLIEVKGPGDRLQDNQIRWLEYCMRHEMPVSVCYVQWAQ